MMQTSPSSQKKAQPTALEALRNYISEWVEEDPSLRIYVYSVSSIENYSIELKKDITET